MTEQPGGVATFISRQWALVAAVCVGSALAHAPSSLMPFQVGALMDGAGRSAEQAGRFGFIEVGALALGMILIAPWIDRLHARRVAFAGAALAAVANVGLFLADSFAAQLFAGATAGLGFGCVFAATISGAACSSQADRLYAIGNGGALLLIMGVMTTLPVVASRFGALGIFVGIAGLVVLCSLCFAGFGRSAAATVTRLAAWRTPGAPGLLFSWAAFSIGSGAVYAFSERIAHHAGIPAQTIGFVLSGGVFVGVAGTGVAAHYGDRIRRRHALTGGMLATAAACGVLGYSTGLATFAVGVGAYWLSTMFLYSYLLGSAARLDSTGRVGTLGGGVERLGYGVGAWAGGVVAQHFGYSSIGAMGVVACLLGLFVGFPSLFNVLEQTSSERPTVANAGATAHS